MVEEDPKEKGIRRILNFGHTVGHAIESSGQFDDYLHGECVGIGMLYFSSDEVKQEITNVLKKFNLPINCNINKDKLLEYMLLDKKRSDDKLLIIFVSEIGSFAINAATIEEVKKYL